jgi:hypothetical protein
MAPPEGGLEGVEINRPQPMIKRRSLIRLAASLTGLAVFTSLTLFVIPLSRKASIDNNKKYITESESPATSVLSHKKEKDEPVQAERMLASHNSKLIRHSVSSLNKDNSIIDNELDDLDESLDEQVLTPAVSIPNNDKKDNSNVDYSEDIISEGGYNNSLGKSHFIISPIIKSSGNRVTSDDLLNSVYSINNQPISHLTPISLGLYLSFELNSTVSVTTGADVSLYRSRILVDKETITQNAYYLGIPLRLDWTVWQSGSVSAWIGGGGKVDCLVYGKFGADRIKDNTLNWSIIGDLGIQYDLSKNVGVFLAPEVSYYFKPENPVIQTYRTQNPLMFTVGAGLRFSL